MGLNRLEGRPLPGPRPGRRFSISLLLLSWPKINTDKYRQYFVEKPGSVPPDPWNFKKLWKILDL